MQKHCVRDSRASDLPEIAAIYAYHVLHGTGTFETAAPAVPEMECRRADVLSKNLPYLVLEEAGVAAQTTARAPILGFAYANWFKPRPAYCYSAEDSVYLHPAHCGQGLGKLLLRALLERAQGAGLRSLIAVIGDSQNQNSIGLHRACGFTHVGILHACGWKFGRWLDVVLMEKALRVGAQAPE